MHSHPHLPSTHSVDFGALLLGVVAPEHKDDVVAVLVHGLNHGVCELLPALRGRVHANER